MILALDLEGTLISSAISAFPRDNLYSFLEFCRENFEKLVIFSTVSESKTREILQILATEGSAPVWFSNLDIVRWDREGRKDLNLVGDVENVLILDDQEAYIVPEQKSRWISICEFLPPFSQGDDALYHAIEEIDKRLFKSNE